MVLILTIHGIFVDDITRRIKNKAILLANYQHQFLTWSSGFHGNLRAPPPVPPSPRNKALNKPSTKTMVVKNPLMRPYFFWVSFFIGRDTLRFPWGVEIWRLLVLQTVEASWWISAKPPGHPQPQAPHGRQALDPMGGLNETRKETFCFFLKILGIMKQLTSWDVPGTY